MKKRTRILSLLLVAILVLSLAPASAHADPPKGDSHLHSWVVISDTPPTCTAPGSKTWKCTACGETYTETYDALGHAPVELAGKPATCTEAGLTVGSKCSRCGQVMKAQESIPALGHSYGKVTVVKQPTCEAEGQSVQVCSRCQDQKVSSVPALGHEWDQGAVTTAPTGLTPGVKTFTCKHDPSHTRTEEIDPLPWVFAMLSGVAIDPSLFDLSNYDIPPLVITEQPVGGAVTRHGEDTHTLHVAATGGIGEYTYEWKYRTNANSTIGNIISWLNLKTSGQRTEPDFEAYDGNMRYWCVVTDEAGNTAQSEAAIVGYKLGIAQQPDNANLQPTGKATLSCQAEDGSGSYTYVWYNAQGDTEVDTGAQVELTVPGDYYCVATDDQTGETAPSNVVTVYDTEPFRLMTFTGDGEHYSDGSGMLKAGFAGGVQPYEIWWDKDGEAIESEDAEVDDYIGAVVYNATIGNYTVHAVDAMGEVITATSHRIAPKLTIVEQPVGGTIPKDGYKDISVSVSDGEAPYRFVLCRNGEHYTEVTDDPAFATFGVWYPGEYYFHIEDSKGRQVDSDAVIFEDAVFRITDQTETSAITRLYGSAGMSVTAEGGKEPYTYTWTYQNGGRWFKVGENADVISVYKPGIYACIVKDSAGQSIKSKQITVTYTGKVPLIVEQPTSHRELNKDVRWIDLKCRAISGTGDDSNLKYDWYTRKSGGGWSIYAADRQSYPGYFEGEYRCKVTDTATGGYTWSEVAVAYEELAVTGVTQTQSWASEARFVVSVKGGLAPYTLKLYQKYPYWTDYGWRTKDAFFYSETYNSLEELNADKWDIPTVVDVLQGINENGELVLTTHRAVYYFVIIDAAGNKYTSAEFSRE